MLRLGAGVALAMLAPVPAHAGPPFLTDDPEPTETGHWEIYGPYFDSEGRGTGFSGGAGVELNYGAAPDLQLTMGLPMAYDHDVHGWNWGRGDLEVSAKYRFYHDEKAGIQIAAFPGLTLPTASHGMGAGRVTAFLPIWAQVDRGAWSVFGGGGYAINPGGDNRNYWTAGLAVTRQVTKGLLLGAEVDRQGADEVGGNGQTSLGAGFICHIAGPFRLLASGGPVFEDHVGHAGFHGYTALGIDF